MPDPVDFDLRASREAVDTVEVSATPNRPKALMVVVGLLVVAAGFAIYLVFGRQTSAPVNEQAAAPATSTQAAKPDGALGGVGDPIIVPPLAESDPLVRELVTKLSSHPRVAAWLATDRLIQNFTVVVENISEGRTPTTHLRHVAPTGPFRIVDRNGDLFIDEQSYQRYDRLADAVASIDAAGSARLYATLKPRIEEANRELGHPEGSFDRTLERAIVSLLAVRAPAGPVEVGPRGIVYGYADDDLESLTAAQKHLLRMGPRNIALIQNKLREIGLALGIPAERLTAPR